MWFAYIEAHKAFEYIMIFGCICLSRFLKSITFSKHNKENTIFRCRYAYVSCVKNGLIIINEHLQDHAKKFGCNTGQRAEMANVYF